jgi:arylsulfatase
MHGAALGALLTIAITLGFAPMAAAQQALDRTVLPIAHPKPPLYTELDVRNATPPPRFQVKAPEDAPNVVIVLVDDLGFAGTSAYGGPVKTPTFDRMAGQGCATTTSIPPLSPRRHARRSRAGAITTDLPLNFHPA